jgi:hypothetical protein
VLRDHNNVPVEEAATAEPEIVLVITVDVYWSIPA